MKKILFLLITAFAVASCNDDCDHGFSTGENISKILVGTWYEETLNEENTYSASGSFYGKYCNTLVQGEGNGRYFIDSENNRLTWSYTSNGSTRTEDWKLTNVSEYGFTMSSDIAILTYGKIVESYQMEAGETKQILFDKETVLGYESKNSNIATVTSGGLITTTGEKGTAYIKIKLSNRNVWAKVIVGDDTPDLWIDYSFLLGKDFAAMKDTLGVQSQSQDFGEYSSYSYITSTHNILKYINVFVDNNTHTITQLDMYLNEGVTQEEIMAYMNSHYYRIAGNYVNQYHYSTASTLEDSRAVFAYDTAYKTLLVMSAEDYLLPNFKSIFGMGKDELKASMLSKGNSFYQSFDSYSQNGSDSYIIRGYDNVYAAEFIFNPDNVVSEYWLYLNATDKDMDTLAELLRCLKNNYTEAKDEYVEGYGMIFYNKDKTIKVTYDLSKFAIVFTDLTKKAVSRVILGKYWEGLGKTTSELVRMFGEPYLIRNNDQGNLQYFYAVITDYIASVTFNFNKKGEVNLINIFLRDEVKAEVVKDYLNSLYSLYEEVSTEQGPLTRWINAKKEEDADMKIGFYSDYGVVVYKPAVEETQDVPAEGVIPDYSLFVNVTASQVKAALGNPDREMAGYYVYTPAGHEYVKRVMIKFDDSPITDNSVSSTVSVTLNEKHNQDKLLEFLNSIYTAAPELSNASSYGFKTNDKKVILQYTPSSNSIVFIKSYGF